MDKEPKTKFLNAVCFEIDLLASGLAGVTAVPAIGLFIENHTNASVAFAFVSAGSAVIAELYDHFHYKKALVAGAAVFLLAAVEYTNLDVKEAGFPVEDQGAHFLMDIE